MSIELVTREDLENRALAHYRTKGSKNGERLYQYEDGSLTPLGRIHYGVGKAKDAAAAEVKDHVKIATSSNNADKNAAKAELNEHRAERAKEKSGSDSVTKFDYRASKFREKEKKLREKEEKRNRSDKEIKKDVEDKIKDINDKLQTAKKERDEKAKEEKASLKKEQSEIRSLTDSELDKRISRLQKEKQYSELLNERSHREKGTFEKVASEYFKKFGERLANKAIDKLTDKVLQKAFKDQSSSKNKDNQNNNQPDNSNPNKNPSNPGNGGNGQKFSKAEKSQIRSMAGSGKSVADIAKALGTTEDRVKSYMAAAGVTIS